MWWMRNNNSVLADRRLQPTRRQTAECRKQQRLFCLRLSASCLLFSGCVTPQYAVRPTPTPEESAWAKELEQTISAYQARGFERHGVQMVQPGERLSGFDLQGTVNRLSRVTERPSLRYRVLMYRDSDPNAAALADGRVYLSTGILNYLASRGSRESELAFVIAHELAHTVAQHLVKRYRQLQQQQMMLTVVGLGTAIATRQGGAQAQQVGELAQRAASLMADVVASGYSQEQELEADQLGIRYVIRAGYTPWAALDLLEDFTRFETPWPFLRTHPYIEHRRQDLERYLVESGAPRVPSAGHGSGGASRGVERPRVSAPRAGTSTSPTAITDQRKRLLEAQKLYPAGSQSWKNIQKQLDEVNR